MCPERETPEAVSSSQAPRPGVVKSLGMSVERLEDGRWAIRAAWLDGPAIGNTWPEAYWAAVRAK
jgi:hypothetical protein